MSKATGVLVCFTIPWLMHFQGVPDCCASDKRQLSFGENVAPFLAKHCYDCHSDDDAEAGFRLKRLKSDFGSEETANRWIDVLHSLQFNEMPPPDADRPDPIEKADVIAWIFQKMEETGRFDGYRKKLLAPEYGNWVSHEMLFSGQIDTPPFSPSRLWRFSPDIFRHKGFGRARSPYTYVTAENGIRDYSAMSKVDQSTVQMILITADSFLEHRDTRGEFKQFAEDQPTPSDQMLIDTVNREFLRVIGRNPNQEERERYLAFFKRNIADGGNLDGLKTTIKAMFLSPEAVFRMELGHGPVDEYGRRHLSSQELAHAVAYALTDQAPDRNRLIRDAYAQGKVKDKADVARLVRQLLDEQLGQGRWDNLALPRVMRFFEEYFGFNRAGVPFKDQDRRRLEAIPQWNTTMLVHDARMLIEHVLKRDQDVISELLTTNQFFIAHPGNNEYAKEFYEQRIAEITAPKYVETQVKTRREQLERQQKEWALKPEEVKRRLDQARNEAERKVAQYRTALEKGIHPHPNFPFSPKSRGIADLIYIAPYNLPTNDRLSEQHWNWPVEQPLEMPSEQRAGLLTHPAWLAAHSLNDGNDPIRRGTWIQRKLLAGVIQDVPPDVDANVPADPHKTLRERMEPLRSEKCWRCHRKMNPLGEPFEIFDDWGRHRTHVYFDRNNELVTRRDGQFKRMLDEGKLTAREVNAAGSISGSGDPEVDGAVDDAIDMMHRLGRSTRARQSFIRHLFRYFMGRNEMLSDSQTLIEAEQAYVDNSGSFKSLVVSLLSSDSFLYRR